MALGNQQDFSMHSGDDRVLTVTVLDSAGSAVNITGGTITWALSKQAADAVEPKGDALITKSTSVGGVTITDGPNGQCSVTLVEADTADLAGTYYHEMQVVLSGDTSTVLYGTATIKKDLI